MTRAGTLGPPLCLALAAAALAAAWWYEPIPNRREDVALLMGDDLGPGPALDDGARRLAERLVDGAERERFASSEVFFGARELGYTGWPHPLLREFDAIRSRPDAGDLLERVVAAGGSAARLYAMALLREVDRARYERLRPRIAQDQQQVWWSDGCSGSLAAPSAILEKIDRGLSFAP